jgi:hypothetical protein
VEHFENFVLMDKSAFFLVDANVDLLARGGVAIACEFDEGVAQVGGEREQHEQFEYDS